MKRRGAIILVYASGVAQGLAFTAFPAAGNIFKSQAEYALTSSQYGALFLPMYACAIAASSGAGVLARRVGLKRVYLAGFALNAAAMGLLAASQAFAGSHGAAYVALLVAIGALGAGFGATLTAINTYAPRYFPARSDTALTALHTLLGTGTALPPVLLAVAIALGGWWLLPLATGALLLALAAVAATCSFPEASAPGDSGESAREPARLGGRFFVLLAAVAVYGVCEALYGNWGVIFLHGERGLSTRTAGLALTLFWAMVTAGRLVIAVLSMWIPSRFIYPVLPLVIGGAFLGASRMHGELAELMAFAAAGFGCSAFLPLSISFATSCAPQRAEMAAGIMMVAYMAGAGLGAFGVGPLREAAGLTLVSVFAGGAAVAAALLVLAAVSVRGAGGPPARPGKMA